MSKGKWFTTKDNIQQAIHLWSNSSVRTRAQLVKALVKRQGGISYASANYAVNKAAAIYPRIFENFVRGSVETKEKNNAI